MIDQILGFLLAVAIAAGLFAGLCEWFDIPLPLLGG